MTETEIQHFNLHKAQIDAWIDTKARLQRSSDILKPLISAYERETGYKVSHCEDCLIDCLIWCRMQVKHIVMVIKEGYVKECRQKDNGGLTGELIKVDPNNPNKNKNVRKKKD